MTHHYAYSQMQKRLSSSGFEKTESNSYGLQSKYRALLPGIGKIIVQFDPYGGTLTIDKGAGIPSVRHASPLDDLATMMKTLGILGRMPAQ